MTRIVASRAVQPLDEMAVIQTTTAAGDARDRKVRLRRTAVWFLVALADLLLVEVNGRVGLTRRAHLLNVADRDGLPWSCGPRYITAR
jgi:hypothetical protein